MSNQRIAYFDFLRGIAIIMVVGIHTFSLSYSDKLPYMLMRQILNCAVPLFLALSGFFIAKKDLSTPERCKAFWKRQIPTVYIPCIVFSSGWFLLEMQFSKLDNLPINIFNLVFCGFSIYYFIALIIQFYILAPILLKYKDSSTALIVTGVISAICITVVSYILYVKQLKIGLIFYAGPCVLWIFFFMLGIYISFHRQRFSLPVSLAVMFIGFVASVAENYYFKTYHTGGIGIKLSSFIFSTGVRLSLLSPKTEKRYKQNYLTRIILRIGEISFGIYFLHMYVKLGLEYLYFSNNWFLDWCLILIISSLIILISKSIFSFKINQTLFGFR